jgi:hypothetical protein
VKGKVKHVSVDKYDRRGALEKSERNLEKNIEMFLKEY